MWVTIVLALKKEDIMVWWKHESISQIACVGQTELRFTEIKRNGWTIIGVGASLL